MNDLLERYLNPPRAPEGGDGAAAAGDGGAGDGGSAASAGAAGAAAGDGGAGSGAAAPVAGEPYRPDGLPDTAYGANDRETMDKMAGIIKGYRERDASRSVPEKADAYNAFEMDKVDAGLKPHLEQLVKDPLYAKVAEVALAEKVPVGTMQKIVTTLYGEAIKAGVFEGFIDVDAERAQLLPDSAKSLGKADQDKAIDARMQKNADFLALLAKPGADGKAQIDAKIAKHVELMLLDSAAGNQFLEFFQDQMTGAGRAQPFGGGSSAGGGDTREALKARLAAPEMQHGHPKFDAAAHEELMADYRKAIGN